MFCVFPHEWSFQEKPRIKAIVSTKLYQDMQQRYTTWIHNETKRYHLFTELVNHAMEKLRAQNKFVVSFCRNDPIIIKGSHAQRKPNGVGVESDVLNEGERGGVDNLSKEEPVRNAFSWIDLVSFLEFKVKMFVLSAGKTTPSEAIGRASSTVRYRCFFLVVG